MHTLPCEPGSWRWREWQSFGPLAGRLVPLLEPIAIAPLSCPALRYPQRQFSPVPWRCPLTSLFPVTCQLPRQLLKHSPTLTLCCCDIYLLPLLIMDCICHIYCMYLLKILLVLCQQPCHHQVSAPKPDELFLFSGPVVQQLPLDSPILQQPSDTPEPHELSQPPTPDEQSQHPQPH